jgi:hypothetical protein
MAREAKVDDGVGEHVREQTRDLTGSTTTLRPSRS